MFDVYLRRVKDDIMNLMLIPLLEMLNRMKITANHITVLSLFFGLLCSYCIYVHYSSLAVLLWIVNRILDGVDGFYARRFDQQSDFGGYLDILVDFIIYLSIPFSSVFTVDCSDTSSLGRILCFYYISMNINVVSLFYLSSISKKEENELTTISMPRGLIEGGETIIIYTLMIALKSYLGFILAVSAILYIMTAVSRFIWAYDNLNTKSKKV